MCASSTSVISAASGRDAIFRRSCTGTSHGGTELKDIILSLGGHFPRPLPHTDLPLQVFPRYSFIIPHSFFSSFSSAMSETTSDVAMSDDLIPLSHPFLPPPGCPINNLPIELLGQIFSWGVYTDVDDDEDLREAGIEKEIQDSINWMNEDLDEEDEDDRSVNENDLKANPPSDLQPQLPFQVLVSHVCRFWRDVALNMPSLWTNLDFTEGPPFTKSRVWIERSQNLPLDIHIDCGGSDDDDDDDEESSTVSEFSDSIATKEDLIVVLGLIVPHVARWRSLRVEVESYDYMHLALTSLAECPAAPQLECLQLSHHDDADVTELFQPEHLREFFLPFHGIAPKLNSVNLWGVHIMWSAPFLSGLTDLELAYHSPDVSPSWEDFSRMLRNSPSLETLSLCMSGAETLPTDVTEEDVIELPSLKSLVLSYQDAQHVSRLVKLLPTPNLRKLVLDLESDDFSSFVTELATPSSDTKPSLLHGLEHLKITSLACDHRLVERMYGQLVNLKSITLSCSFLHDNFFLQLIPTVDQSSPTALCPNLDMITTSGIEGAMMKELVAARKAAGFPIRSILMGEDDVVTNSTEKWLRANVQSFGYFEPSDEETDDEDDDDEL